MISINVTSGSTRKELALASKLIELMSVLCEPALERATDHTPAFNATELKEADALAASTVVVSPSAIVPTDTTVNTSTPDPKAVFGHHAPIVVNVVNPVAPITPNHAVDVKGMPWDARIHSNGRTLIQAGTWKYKKGVSDETIDAVEAELRGASVPTPPAVTVPVPPVPVITQPASEGTTFNDLLNMVSEGMVSGAITQAQLTQVLSEVGVTALPLLMTQPALIQTVVDKLEAL